MARLKHAFESADSKRTYVRRLFGTIADRYDFITGFLSYGQDRRWKRHLIREASPRRGQLVVDLACGTGDITLGAAATGATVTGLDITPRMVELARQKARRAQQQGMWPIPNFVIGDMAALPFSDASIDVITSGYGLRNVPVLEGALDEITRVLRPGGRLLSLDFNRPASRFVRGAYLLYLTVVGSALGWVLHGDPDTYRYIPESIRHYPGASGISALLRARGFDRVTAKPLLGGLMTLHIAEKR